MTTCRLEKFPDDLRRATWFPVAASATLSEHSYLDENVDLEALFEQIVPEELGEVSADNQICPLRSWKSLTMAWMTLLFFA